MIEAMRALLLPFVVALAACASGSGEAPAGPAPGSIIARFPPGDARDVLQVTVSDRLAARAVELVGPNGLVAPAYTIESQQATRTEPGYGGWGFGPTVGLGVGGGSRGVGSGIGLTLPLGGMGAPSTTTVVDQTVTNAFVRIPDLNDYRQNWQAYKIRLQLGTAPNIRFITIDAPPPPA
jgi:hypothetical protein